MMVRRFLLPVLLILILAAGWIWDASAAQLWHTETGGLVSQNLVADRYDGQDLEPIAKAYANSVSSIKVRAFPQNAVTGTRGKQVIYVIALDQRSLPLTGAQAVITVTLPDGQSISYVVPKLSDEYGIIQFDFLFNSQQIGLSIVEIQVAYQGVKADTVTSFRIWK